MMSCRWIVLLLGRLFDLRQLPLSLNERTQPLHRVLCLSAQPLRQGKFPPTADERRDKAEPEESRVDLVENRLHAGA